MACGKTQASDAAVAHLAQKLGETRGAVQVAAIGVHVLTEQGDLLDALPYQAMHFFKDILEDAAALATAHVGHDAVGAKVVAAIGDGHPGMEGVVALGRQVTGAHAVLVGLGDSDAMSLASKGGGKQVGKTVDGVGAKDDVDVAQDVEELVAVALADAAAHSYNATLASLTRGNVAHGLHLTVQPRVGSLAHTAGKEDDNVGLFDFGDLKRASRLQHAAHALGVMEVHLAAEGTDEVGAAAQGLHGVGDHCFFGVRGEGHGGSCTVKDEAQNERVDCSLWAT